MQPTQYRNQNPIFSYTLTNQELMINTKVALPLPKRVSQMTAQQKNEQFRQQSRSNQIESIKRAARFSWNVQQTLKYLREVNYKLVESEEVLDDAIREQNIQYLGELVVAADPQFKSAVVSQRKRIMILIKQKLHKPSSILLLGNLCALYVQYVRQANRRGLLGKMMADMSNMKGNSECINIYSWVLTKMTMYPDLVDEQEMQNSISQLYVTLSWAFSNQTVSSQICTNLMRLTLNFSNAIVFYDDFLKFLTTLKLKREVDIVDLILIFDGQIKKCSYSTDSLGRIQIVNCLLQSNKQIKYSQIANSKVGSFFKLISILVGKSQSDVSDYIVDRKFKQIMGDYCYGKQDYYKMMEQILMKMDDVTNEQFLQNMKFLGIIDNLIHDISDLNSIIGYSCLKIVKIIVWEVKCKGKMDYLQWILSMELDKQVNSFLCNINNQDSKAKQVAQTLLDIITNGDN